ncbi:MAG: FAD-dependent oxidoreductase [Deltaproteobacteria bacterium]|nr:FAD-dependent oxidoreductase [Deltaproteobacteria bacterium]
MPKMPVQLLSRDEIAQGTLRYRFTKPAELTFKAGQYVSLGIPDPPYRDKKGPRRPLTLASAPNDDVLEFAWRTSDSAFKSILAAAPLGSTYEVVGPIGTFALHDDPTVPAVLVAGGIGITPFRSMLRDVAARGLTHPITLLYWNRNPEQAAYLDELAELDARLPNLKLMLTMTQPETSARGWDGLTERINLDLLRECVGDLQAPMYYVAGPHRIIVAVTEALTVAGVDLARLKKDEFTGY